MSYETDNFYTSNILFSTVLDLSSNIYIYIYINPISYNAENEQSRPGCDFLPAATRFVGAKKAHSPQNPNSPIFFSTNLRLRSKKMASFSLFLFPNLFNFLF